MQQNASLDNGYRTMASDQVREAEAVAWCNALANDMAADKTRLKAQLGTLSKADLLAVEDAIKLHLALPR